MMQENAGDTPGRLCENCGTHIGAKDTRCPSCSAVPGTDAGGSAKSGIPASGTAVLGMLRERVRSSFSRALSSASLRRDVLAGVLLSLGAALSAVSSQEVRGYFEHAGYRTAGQLL